jgi:hypothetical protein
MKKIKVIGEFEQIAPYIPDTPQFTGIFNAAIDALHNAVSDAWNNVKKEELKTICQDVEVALQDPNIDADFGPLLTSLEVVLGSGGRFKRRALLQQSVEEIRTYLDEHGKGPQNPITRELFEPITEASLLDRTNYNEEDDLLVIVSKSQNTEGLIALVRVLPHVNARNTLIVQTEDEWIEDTVEPYLNGLVQIFEEQLGKVVSVQDDALNDKLIDLLESAQE